MPPAFRHSYEADGAEAGKVEVAGRILHQTEKAILFDDTGGAGAGKWLPKSKIKIEPAERGTVTIYLPEWLAKDKGLI